MPLLIMFTILILIGILFSLRIQVPSTSNPTKRGECVDESSVKIRGTIIDEGKLGPNLSYATIEYYTGNKICADCNSPITKITWVQGRFNDKPLHKCLCCHCVLKYVL